MTPVSMERLIPMDRAYNLVEQSDFSANPQMGIILRQAWPDWH